MLTACSKNLRGTVSLIPVEKKENERSLKFVEGAIKEKDEVLRYRHQERAALPDFPLHKIPKQEKIYQISTNYIKCP
jgi:hypothetical protein